MKSFPEFEAVFLNNLQQERSDLQGLQGAAEAQLSAWIQHLFQQYLGYTHWKEITREGAAPIGAKGTKQLFPDLRINVLDNGLIFIECKRMGRLDGPKGQDELNDAVNQLRSYIRAHIDQSSVKPKTVLGVVTDGNRWLLLGLNRMNEFHTITEWAFLTDDPRLIAQRMWLLAKPALAQPISALVEFLARRTLAEVLKDDARRLTKKVNERLPDGAVSEDLIARWLRDALADPTFPPRLVPGEPQKPDKVGPEPDLEPGGETSWPVSRRQVALEAVAGTKPDAVPGDESPEITKTGKSIDDKNEIAGPMADLYQELRAFLLALGSDVTEKPTKLYIAYRRGRTFAEVKVQKSQLLVYLRIDPRRLTLEEGFSRDVSEIGHHGIGNLELTIKTKADLKKAEPLLARSYDGVTGRPE